MAVLNDWQKITRVISAKPWGDGTDGNATISSDSNTRATVIGTAGQLTVTAGSSAFANGDLVLIQQTQGTGAGQWEINMVASGGGTTSLVMKEANHYTFASGAQIVKIPRYTTATVSAHAVSAFNGSINGVEFICASVSITVSGALNGNGGNGNQGHGAVAGGTGRAPCLNTPRIATQLAVCRRKRHTASPRQTRGAALPQSRKRDRSFLFFSIDKHRPSVVL